MTDRAAGLRIVYRDDAMVVIDKPEGLLVHRSPVDRHETRFAVQMLRDQIGQRVYPAHRLDRGTSGVLVFALDAEAARSLGQQFQAGTKRSRYLAVVRGHLTGEGSIDHPLADVVDAHAGLGGSAARPAVTRYRSLATAELPVAIDRYPTSRFSLVSLEPATGRRHQIRRHLKHLAHPIIGDATYGKGRYNRYFAGQLGIARLLLACVSVSLTHPASGEALTLVAPLHDAFASLIDRFGWRGALPADWIEAAPRVTGFHMPAAS